MPFSTAKYKNLKNQSSKNLRSLCEDLLLCCAWLWSNTPLVHPHVVHKVLYEQSGFELSLLPHQVVGDRVFLHTPTVKLETVLLPVGDQDEEAYLDLCTYLRGGGLVLPVKRNREKKKNKSGSMQGEPKAKKLTQLVNSLY